MPGLGQPGETGIELLPENDRAPATCDTQSPFSITSRLHEQLVFAIHIHNAIFQVKFPLVFASIYLQQ